MPRDYDVLDDVRARLVATKEFDAVYRSALPETKGQSAGDRFAAAVEHRSWEELSESADPSVIQSTRKLKWRLTLLVRDDDPEVRERELDRLLAVAQDALDGQSLAGVTLPDWTYLSSGVYEDAKPPEQHMRVEGYCAYYIEGWAGHDGSDEGNDPPEGSY